jgi:hypothetical protein
MVMDTALDFLLSFFRFKSRFRICSTCQWVKKGIVGAKVFRATSPLLQKRGEGEGHVKGILILILILTVVSPQEEEKRSSSSHQGEWEC